MKRSIGMVIGMLAVLKAGGAYVPMDARYPRPRLEMMLEDSDAKLMLIDDANSEEEWAVRTDKVNVEKEREEISKESTDEIGVKVEAENLAYVIYTSGSTGRPKGVAIEHGSLKNLVMWHQQAYKISANDRASLLAGQAFDASVWELWPYLATGASIHIPPEEIIASARELVTWLGEEEITMSFLPTPLAEAALETRWPEGSKLRYLLTGGDRLRRGAMKEPNFKLINHYGPTESTVVTTSGEVGVLTEDGQMPSIGRPISNTRVYLLDRQMQPVPIGVTGEIYIAGEGLARCYLDRADLTAGSFVPDGLSATAGGRLYKTGDLARSLRDGSVEYIGRSDHQVKIRGFRIELGEIEAEMGRHPAIRDVAVLARDSMVGGVRLVAYVVANQEQPFTVAKVRSFLKARLPEYMVPSHFVVMADLPVTPNGKVDRSALPEPDGASSELEESYVAPRTPLEEVLVGIWAGILNVEQIGIHQDFFDLGGHSLLATRVISKVREVLHIELPLRTLFENTSIAAFGESIDRARQANQDFDPEPILPSTREGELPLSFAQERMWFLNQMEPYSYAYNIPVVVRLTGKFDLGALESSFDEIFRRHEVLRTSFIAVEGRPVQVVAPALSVKLDVLDLSAHQERRAELERLTSEEARRCFDLTRAPLLRAGVVRLEDEVHVLMMTVHHIISDGWSVGILINEVTRLYESFSRSSALQLPELAVQYADFATWQRQWLSDERMKAQFDYWKKQLDGGVALLDLPTDRNRPSVQTFQGARQSLVLSQALSKSLKTLSRQQEGTMFMTLLAAFQTLLYRYSGQDQIQVGTPIAGRNRAEIEALIGMFVNTLVMRTDMSGDPTFRELLARVREVALGAYANQELPFEKLVEHLQPSRDLSHSPLFQVMFNLLNLEEPRIELPGLTVESMSVGEVASKFDVTLYARESAEGIRLELVYNARLFADDRMVLMLDQFDHLLNQIAENPEERIAKYSLVTSRTEAILPNPAQPLRSDTQEAVHNQFLRQALRVPERTAILEKQGGLTYSELDAYSNQFASCLRAHGVERQSIVAIYGRRSAALVVAMLGILKAGAAFMILDPAYPSSRLIDCLSAVKPKGWVQLEVDELPESLEVFLSTSSDVFRVRLPAKSEASLESFRNYTRDACEVSITADDPAYVAFTSGSTGKPKGILGTHGPLTHFIDWHIRTFNLSEGDRFSMLSGLSHDPLLRDIFTPLALGATLCIADAEDLGASGWLAKWMEQQEISVAHLTPAMCELLTEALTSDGEVDQTVLASLRYAFLGGDVLTRTDVERLQRLAPRVSCVNYYGSTETPQAMGYFVASDPVDPGADDPSASVKETIPLGRGIDDVQLLILNSTRELAGVGELGEIYIRTPYLSKGYLGDDKLTIERFITNPFTRSPDDILYKTGDLARYLPDGNVEYLGRRDNQVKLRGFRIELGEIDAALARYPEVRQATTVLREDSPGEKRLVAYVVADPTKAPTISQLQTYLRGQLPDYMVPSAFMILESLPLTPNGKIDHRALSVPESGRPVLAECYVAPQTELERMIVAIWQLVLPVSKVGVNDNFFDLGGHSLLVVKVNSKLRTALNRTISIVEMFKYPTVSSLAKFLQQEETPEPSFVRIQNRARKAKEAIDKQKRRMRERRGIHE